MIFIAPRESTIDKALQANSHAKYSLPEQNSIPAMKPLHNTAEAQEEHLEMNTRTKTEGTGTEARGGEGERNRERERERQKERRKKERKKETINE